jgi:hypothetical protein
VSSYTKSSIDRCKLIDATGKLVKRFSDIDRRNDSTIRAETEAVTIGPGDTMTVATDFSEIRRLNDHMVSVFTSPTKNPRIHVNAQNFYYALDFGVLDQRAVM